MIETQLTRNIMGENSIFGKLFRHLFDKFITYICKSHIRIMFISF